MDWLPLAYACICIFIAAVVRGFSGFGFSLLAISALSLVYSPAEIVPSIFMLELAASLHLLPSIWKDIHWKSLWPLTLGCLVATPFGVWLLANVPAAPMQLGLSVFVMAATVLLWRGFALQTVPGVYGSSLVGAASGLANGAFGIGGPPVILFYFASPAGATAGRASLIMFFLITDVIGLANLAMQNLVEEYHFVKSLIWLPPLFAGVWLGARSFKSVDPEGFRRGVLILLWCIALTIATKSAASLDF
jgi:uncharacterized protein